MLITYQNILISVHVFMAWFFQDTEVVVHFIKTVWRRNTLTQVNFLICVQFRTFKWCNCNIQPFSRARIFWKRDFALRLLESMSTGQRISLNCKSQTNTLEQIFLRTNRILSSISPTITYKSKHCSISHVIFNIYHNVFAHLSIFSRILMGLISYDSWVSQLNP